MEMGGGADLERSVSQQSYTSVRSYRSGTTRASRARKRLSQPSSSASSIAADDKSLTSFPSFGPDSPGTERLPPEDDFRKAAAAWEQRQPPATTSRPAAISNSHNAVSTRGVRSESIVDSLTGQSADGPRGALFEDAAPVSNIPGALHRADDAHIERLIARHSAVGLVRQIAEDLAQRDAQISMLRRRADEREKALRRIIRECGLSNLQLETRLREVEGEMRESGRSRLRDQSGLSDLMSDAMQDTMAESVYGETGLNGSTLRAASTSIHTNNSGSESRKGTARGWKDYLWGGTAKKSSRASSVNGDGVHPATVLRSQSSADRRPALANDLFNPPPPASESDRRSPSRASERHSSANLPDRQASGSLASLALRLVAGGAVNARDPDARGRAVSSTDHRSTMRASSTVSNPARTARASSVAAGPKALMAMRRSTPAPQAQGSAATRAQAQDIWEGMRGSPPSHLAARQESYGPVEMDAILPPESQPPTLSHVYNNNYSNSEFLTDRFGFIYDQRRKKRQREAAQMGKHIRKGSRPEMFINGRTAISPNMLSGDVPSSPKWSVSSDGRSESPNSIEDKGPEEGRPKRWQDYLKIATFPTELLSHTPSTGAPMLEVTEGSDATGTEHAWPDTAKSPAITPTVSGLIPSASTTTTSLAASETVPSTEIEADSSGGTLLKEDMEPVKLLLHQLSEMHDALQRERTPRWNEFLRKVRAERRRDGEAAVAAAAAAAEARYERPAVILPETRVADGEMIGVAGLGIKGKVGRAKWNEFRNLILGGIPVAFRPKIWFECSGAAELRIPGYYEDLVAENGGDDDSIVVTQIEMDIRRTLTDNIFFRKGPGVQKLNEVLRAYSRRNKDVGYCQGMNLIAANLLLIMPSAEEAFWVLASIVEKILPQGYYDHSLISSRADQQVLRHYVSTVLPKLSAHLDSLSIELEALTFQWFLSVFTDCLCAEALFRVWDVVLCTNDGSTFLFQVALALLKLNEGNLLQCDTPAGVYTYISHNMTEHAISIDGLIQASEGLRREVRREDVEQRRDKAIQADRDLQAEREARNRPKVDSEVPTPPAELTPAEPRPMDE